MMRRTLVKLSSCAPGTGATVNGFLKGIGSSEDFNVGPRISNMMHQRSKVEADLKEERAYLREAMLRSDIGVHVVTHHRENVKELTKKEEKLSSQIDDALVEWEKKLEKALEETQEELKEVRGKMMEFMDDNSLYPEEKEEYMRQINVLETQMSTLRIAVQGII
jgi:vacuolar-type H+-ATPase subunit H